MNKFFEITILFSILILTGFGFSQDVFADNPTFGPAVNVSDDSTNSDSANFAVSEQHQNIYVAWIDQSETGSNPELLNDVFVSKSTDNGASFGPPENISNIVLGSHSVLVGNPKIAVHETPMLQSDHIYVAWTESFFGTGPFPPHLVKFRQTHGVNPFSNNAPITLHSGDRAEIIKLVQQDFQVYVLWRTFDDNGQTNKVFFSKSNNQGQTFSPAVNLNPNPTPVIVGDMTATPGGEVHIVWSTSPPGGVGDAFLTSSHDSGVTFNTPIQLENDPNGGTGVALASTFNNVYVSWNTDDGLGNRALVLIKSTDQGETFDAPTMITGFVTGLQSVDLEASDNSVYVSFSAVDPVDFGTDVFFMRSGNNGIDFSNPANRSHHDGSIEIDEAKIVASDNNVFLSWTLDDGGPGFFLSTSTDYGKLFANPIELSDGEIAGGSKIVATNDNVYALFEKFNGDKDIFLKVGDIPSPTDCVLCLSQQLKDKFQDLSDAFNDFSVVLFPLTPFSLASFPAEIALCAAGGFPSLGVACIPLAVNIGLTIGVPVGEITAQAIADDPPDSNFETVFPIPSYEIIESDVTTESGILLVDFTNAISKQNALQQAFLVTLERYQGALIDDESEFVILQLTTLQEYTDLMIGNQLELTEISSEYSLVVQDLISEEDLELIQQRLVDEDFDQIEIDWLVDMGYTQVQISELQENIIDFDIAVLLDTSEAFNDLSVELIPLTEDLETYSGSIEEFLAQTVLSPEQEIQNLIVQLQTIIDENPGSSLEDKLEDTLDTLQTVLDELNKTPPDNQAALGNIEGAIGDIEAAVNEGLDEIVGTQIMDDLVGVSRQLAVTAIDQAVADPGSDQGKIDTALEKLDEGDNFRDEGKFKDAAAKYKDALSEAESALP